MIELSMYFYCLCITSDNFYFCSENILKELVVLYPRHVIDDVLLSVCPMHIKSLNLDGCNRLSGRAVAAVLHRCNKLQSLSMCDLETNETFHLDFLASLTPDATRSLVSLSLNENFHLEDSHVQVCHKLLVEVVPYLKMYSICLTL